MIFCYVEKVKISGCICFTIEYLSNKMNHCKKLQWFFYSRFIYYKMIKLFNKKIISCGIPHRGI